MDISHYKLVKYPAPAGSPACNGCAFRVPGGKACRAARFASDNWSCRGEDGRIGGLNWAYVYRLKTDEI
jgi:hypothetical protein